MQIIKVIATIILAFLLSIGLLFLSALPREGLYLPFINWILKIKGVENYEGEDRTMEIWYILTEIIFPFFFLISLGIVYKLMYKTRPK